MRDLRLAGGGEKEMKKGWILVRGTGEREKGFREKRRRRTGGERRQEIGSGREGRGEMPEEGRE